MKRIFIHIPKTGGMSIRHGAKALGVPVVHVNDTGGLRSPEYGKGLLAKMEATGEHHGIGHARWRDVRADLQKLPAFAVIRNPWARVASRFFFAKQAVRLKQRYGVNYTNITDFDSFLEERHRWGGEDFYWHRAVRGWYQQLDYVTDERGVIQCDLLRTEHLCEDFKRMFGMDLPERRRNVTAEAEPYQSLYTPEQIQIVADWHQEDIDAFGFDFDSAATRSVLYDVRD